MAGYFLFVCFRLQKCVLLRLQSFLHLLYFAYFHRENTEGTPTQLPANKKCCLLIFAISIGCIVLADIPASSLPVTLVYLVLPSHLAVLCSRFRPREFLQLLRICLLSRIYIWVFFVFPSVPFRSLWYIRYCRSPSSWLSCSAGSPKRSWRFGVHFAVPPARNPLSSTKNHPNYRFLFVFMQKLLYLCKLK